MIPRYQKILFAVLVLASLGMGVALWQLRERAHQRMMAGQDSAPTQAPEIAPEVQATLLVANDADNSLRPQLHSLPLPADPGARAHAVLAKLFDLYAAPDSTHPAPGGAGVVLHVFLMPALGNPALSKPASSSPALPDPNSGDKNSKQSAAVLAVVDLAGSFVAGHPSGLETETLTVLSICGTLHANLPQVAEVRFLVDGEPHATLAGHADLTRTYLAAEATPTAEGQQP